MAAVAASKRPASIKSASIKSASIKSAQHQVGQHERVPYMAWMWGMSASDGSADAAATGPSEADLARAHDLGAPAHGFVSQADAESWLGLVWRDLADQGVQAVSLYEEQRLVYGPMSLSPE